MSKSEVNPPPAEEIPLPRSKRRRVQRALLPENLGERTSWLESLARQLTPSYDFFLSSALSGLILAVGLYLEAAAILVLGLLFSPYLGTVIGISLATVTGSARFLVKSAASLAAGGLFIFGLGALAGAIAPLISDVPIALVTGWHDYHWTNFLVIAIGVILCILILVRSPRQKPLVASIAIAYGLLPPLSAAGFNLTGVAGDGWITGLTVAGVHLAWAVLVGIITFIVLGLAPRTLTGYLLTALMIGVLAAAFLSSTEPIPENPILIPTQQPIVSAPTSSPTFAVVIPTPDSVTPVRTATITTTPTITFGPTDIPTQTITPQPTPIWARVSAPTGGGAFLRDQPDGKILSSILNGNLLEVISEPVRGNNGVIWVQIRTEDGFVGWIVQSLLATATPSAGW